MERLTVANQDLEERVAERTAAVEHSADQLRALTSELALTEAHERQKLSVDLHEGLAQGLTLAIVKLTSLSEDLQDEVGKKQVHAIGKLLSEANHLVRSHIFSLSPPVLQDFGLVHALSWLADDLAQTHGLKVKIRHKGETRLADERIRFTLFRAIRELLINIIKHSGGDRATVSVANAHGEVTVIIEDRGKGFDPTQIQSGSFGLFSIRERLSYLGGRMEIDSSAGKGARITLVAPMDQKGQNDH